MKSLYINYSLYCMVCQPKLPTLKLHVDRY